jgi:hypothetical protein
VAVGNELILTEILGGWQFNWVATFQSGAPLEFTDPGADRIVTSDNDERELRADYRHVPGTAGNSAGSEDCVLTCAPQGAQGTQGRIWQIVLSNSDPRDPCGEEPLEHELQRKLQLPHRHGAPD